MIILVFRKFLQKLKNKHNVKCKHGFQGAMLFYFKTFSIFVLHTPHSHSKEWFLIGFEVKPPIIDNAYRSVGAQKSYYFK